MKKIALTLVCFGFILGVKAQTTTIGFEYDTKGNQTKRGRLQVDGSIAARKTLVNSDIEALLNEPVSKTDSLAIAKHKVKVYPNPTTGALNVQIEGLIEKDQAYYQLVNAQGQNIWGQTKIIETMTLLDLGNAANGVYLLQTQINGETKIWRIVKE